MTTTKALTALLALLLLGVLTFAGCAPKATEANAETGSETKNEAATEANADTTSEQKTLRIGVFADKPPFGYVDADGKNQGFDVYIGKRLAKEILGDESKAEFVLVEAANRVAYLETNKVDLILANFTVTPERAEKVDFSNPYMKVSLGVVSADGAPITKVEDLAGKKLIVNKGTTAEAYFTENHPEIELLKFEQNTEAFAALTDGRGAALAHDNTLLFAWAKENAGFTVGVPTLGEPGVIAGAVQKGNAELLKQVNDTLAALGKEKFIEEAYNATLKNAFGDNINLQDVIIEGGQ